MKNTWIFPAAALVVGAAGGYLTGKQSQPASDSAAENRVSTRHARSGRAEKSDDTGRTAAGKRSGRPLDSEAIARMPGNSERIKALLDFYAGLTPAQLEDEAHKLETLPMGDRIVASMLLYGRWAEKDPQGAMTFSRSQGITGMFARQAILKSWASVDPVRAAEYFKSNPREFAMLGGGGGRRGPFGGSSPAATIASEWARQDPAAALAWSSSLPNDADLASSGVLAEVAKTDPKLATTMLAGLQGDGDKSEAYYAIALQYGASKFADAEAWIRTLPADEQAAAMAAAVKGLSNKDPQAAAQKIAALSDGNEKNEAIASVATDWARENPADAAQFLKSQNNAQAQQNAMPGLMSSWASQNSAAALNYARSFEPGPVQDSALKSYVENNHQAAPADLIKVAESIGDEGGRTRTIGWTAARWMQEDPTAAKAYIQQSSLSDQYKQMLIDGRGIGRGRR